VGVRLIGSDSNEILTNALTSNDLGIELIRSDMNFVKFNLLQGNAECIQETDSVGNHFIRNECIP